MDDLALYFSNREEHGLSDDRNQGGITRTNAKHRITEGFVLPRRKFSNSVGGSCSESSEHFCAKPVSKNENVLQMNTQNLCSLQDMPQWLPPEVEVGNIEYKRKLINPSPNRFEHLVTQMKWRLNEGGGEAIYRLGVDDDGSISGLAPTELKYSLTTLQRMAARLNATLHPLRERKISMQEFDGGQPCKCNPVNQCQRKAVELLVRQCPTNNLGEPSICVAVLGGVDAGKSTLIGVLTDGELDNARGRARLNLFRHLHEVQSGRTSSLSSELLGFNAFGVVTNYTRTDGRLCRASTDEVVHHSAQIVTLLDLAGHSKYQRTTLAGLSRSQPIGVLLVVSAITGLTTVGMEHAELAYGLGLPMAVVITKIDQLNTEGERARQVNAIRRQLTLKLSRTKPGHFYKGDKVSSSSECGCSRYLHGSAVENPRLFLAVSAVTGEGMDKVIRLLGRLACACRLNNHPTSEPLINSNQPPEFSSCQVDTEHTSDITDYQLAEKNFLEAAVSSLKISSGMSKHPTMCFWICELFTNVPGVRDPVVFGILQSGQLTVNHVAFVGPDAMGCFHLVQIVSLKHNRQPYQVVYAGQTASVAIRFQAISTTHSHHLHTTTGADHLIPFENDENQPSECQSVHFYKQPHLTAQLRRGMVLLSHLSWSDQQNTLMSIPSKITHISNADCSIAVAWTFEFEVYSRLSTISGSKSCRAKTPSMPIPNQRVNVYAGSVAQAAVVMTVEEHDANQADSTCGRFLIRFIRHPEYLEVGRRVILTWAGYAKAVGYVVSLHDFIDVDTPPETTCKLHSDGRITITTTTEVSEKNTMRMNMSFPQRLTGQLSCYSKPQFGNDRSGFLSTSLNGHSNVQKELDSGTMNKPGFNSLPCLSDTEKPNSAPITLNDLETDSAHNTDTHLVKNAIDDPGSQNLARKRGSHHRKRRRKRPG